MIFLISESDDSIQQNPIKKICKNISWKKNQHWQKLKAYRAKCLFDLQ